MQAFYHLNVLVIKKIAAKFKKCNYIVIMKTRIIKIGNSQGIRIPKIILEQSGLSEEVELEIQDKQLIIRPTRHARQGWEDAFRTMSKNHDDQLLDIEYLNESSWDEEEWKW